MSNAIETRGWKGDKQILLVFTSERIIVARKGLFSDIAGSGVLDVAGGVAGAVASHVAQKKITEKQTKKIDFDELVTKQKGSYAIPYNDIKRAEMKKKMFDAWLEIMTYKDTKHRFKRITGDKKKGRFPRL